MKVNRALEEVKRAETNAAAAATAAASLVVLETSVTPRQRPKGLNAALPKSPNVERKHMSVWKCFLKEVSDIFFENCFGSF
jgi:hypothetical protein